MSRPARIAVTGAAAGVGVGRGASACALQTKGASDRLNIKILLSTKAPFAFEHGSPQSISGAGRWRGNAAEAGIEARSFREPHRGVPRAVQRFRVLAARQKHMGPVKRRIRASRVEHGRIGGIRAQSKMPTSPLLRPMLPALYRRKPCPAEPRTVD